MDEEKIDVEKIELTEFQQSLWDHFNASMGVITIQSYEDHRLEDAIKLVAAKVYASDREVKYYKWTCTEGFKDHADVAVATGENGGNDRPILDAIQALSYTRSFEDKSIIVMFNFHEYLKHPMVKQYIKDLGAEFRQVSKNLIITGAQIELPIEIEKDVAWMEFALPTEEEVKICLEDTLKDADLDMEEIEEDRIAALVRSAQGMTSQEISGAYALGIVKKQGDLDPETIQEEKSKQLKKSTLIDVFHPETNMNEVGGLDRLKGWLELRKSAFTKEARDYGLPIPKGIMLLGIPGCGKSLVGKAIAVNWGLPLLYFDIGKVFGSLVGQSEANVNKIIATAEAMAPCILFVDEIEKGLAGVQSSGNTDSGVTARVFGKLLTWLQEKKSFVFVVATCNNIDSLPPEFLRRGRFDNLVYVDLPNHKERKEIFEIHLKKRGRKPKNYNLEKLSNMAQDLTGSEIEEIVNGALFRSFSDGKRKLADKDLEAELREINPLTKTMKTQIDTMRAKLSGRAMPASTPMEKKSQGQKKKRNINV